MKRVVLTPNPYRDKNFATVRTARQVLEKAGMEVKICLPFEVDKSYELPKDMHFAKIDRELPLADVIICFGGDGTILHMAKMATRYRLPILGVNIGTMGFMAELESSELDVAEGSICGVCSVCRRGHYAPRRCEVAMCLSHHILESECEAR